jgi:hypothetical protein
MMTDLVAVALTAGFTAIGLLIGMGIWKFYVAFSAHSPNCPYKDEVIKESKRVVLDITQLTQGRQS